MAQLHDRLEPAEASSDNHHPMGGTVRVLESALAGCLIFGHRLTLD
jgi:hypothetical protein